MMGNFDILLAELFHRPVLIGIVGVFLLLWKYSFVACSAPGIIYRNDMTTDQQLQPMITSNDPENPQHSTTQTITTITRPPGAMECGHCNMLRPGSARHCIYCKTCIEDLDHHCPWCGKCIGDRTIDAFHEFIQLLCLQIWFLVGSIVYLCIYLFFNSEADLPSGPHF